MNNLVDDTVRPNDPRMFHNADPQVTVTIMSLLFLCVSLTRTVVQIFYGVVLSGRGDWYVTAEANSPQYGLVITVVQFPLDLRFLSLSYFRDTLNTGLCFPVKFDTSFCV